VGEGGGNFDFLYKKLNEVLFTVFFYSLYKRLHAGFLLLTLL
jgi:hypothetical protein